MPIRKPTAQYDPTPASPSASRLDEVFPRPRPSLPALDRAGAALGLLLLAPLFLLIAAAIRWQDHGPVFHRACRVGQDGALFTLLKFRTMVVGADKRGPGITTAGDARITRVGRFLRRTKLDELPQLLNVLRGEMSLVGPRPEDPRYVALYTPAQCRVLLVRPGITSAASLAYRHEEHILDGAGWEHTYVEEVMPAKLALDLAYLARRTPLTDIGLLLRTVWALVPIPPPAASTGRTPGRPGAHARGGPEHRPIRGWRVVAPLVAFLPRLRNRHFLAIDLLIFLGTPGLALVLRLDGQPDLRHFGRSLLVVTALFLAIKLAVLFKAGLYTRFWRYAGIDDLAQITALGLLAIALQTLAFFAVLEPAHLLAPGFPQSIPLLEGVLAMVAVGGVRYSVPLEERLRHRGASALGGERVVVVGAGTAGVMIVDEMLRNPALGLRPVAFVDDAPEKRGARIRGIYVLGRCADIAQVAEDTGARQVIIAIPTAPGKTIREIVESCKAAGLRTKTIPGMYELLDGTVNVKQIRDVQIDDLLRRDPVRTDTAAVAALIRGKRVLITGGGGSIGGELCRQVLRFGPASLVILGHGENSVFEIYHELLRLQAQLVPLPGPAGAAQPPATPIVPIIADIRLSDRIAAVFAEHRPEIVFHSAAHKHVPLMESNPSEAVTNNVLGTRNLLQAALAAGVEHFVMISSDKAVNPTSVMGASKRAAELLVHQAAQQSGKPYVAVRFGNVLGSRGSVVLTFQRQIAAGGPVTLTHPEMVRYFMTIPEAVQLVLQAAPLSRGGEIFMLDMGEPVRIMDLAQDLIKLSGLQVGRDIDIIATGMRPGEKLYEELFIPGEEYKRTRHDKIFIVGNAGHFVPACLDAAIAALQAAAERHDTAAILAELQALIPEFRPAGDAVAGKGRHMAPLLAAESPALVSPPGADGPRTGLPPPVLESARRP